MFDIIHVGRMRVHWEHCGTFRTHIDAHYSHLKGSEKNFFSPQTKKGKKTPFWAGTSNSFFGKKKFLKCRLKKIVFLEESY